MSDFFDVAMVLLRENERLRQDNEALRRLLGEAIRALPEKRRGRQLTEPVDARYWTQEKIDRLAHLCNITVKDDPPRLSLVPQELAPREAHSHAEKGHAG